MVLYCRTVHPVVVKVCDDQVCNMFLVGCLKGIVVKIIVTYYDACSFSYTLDTTSRRVLNNLNLNLKRVFRPL